MAPDSVSEIEAVDGAQLMQVANAAQSGLNFYRATYLNARDSDEPWPNFDPEPAWVSESADDESQSWKTAVKVRKALSIAIDRQTIIEELLLGFGHPKAGAVVKKPVTNLTWSGNTIRRLPKPSW